MSDDIEITILGSGEHQFGSNVDKKGEPLVPKIEQVTEQNWGTYFPNIRLTPDRQKELNDGTLYLKVALDPNTGERAGFVEVRRLHNNHLSVEVTENFQRRGVATTLIKQAQQDHDYLQLTNFAGKIGEALYAKLGFNPQGKADLFTWKK